MCRYLVCDSGGCAVGAQERLTDLWRCPEYQHRDPRVAEMMARTREATRRLAQDRITAKLAKDGLWKGDDDEKENAV
jgi:hypothetical protein